MNVHKNGGFTIFEMLVVLFLVMSLTAIVSKFSLKIAETKELERFFTQLQLDIQYIQTYSMSQRQYIALKMDGSTIVILFKKIFILIYMNALFQRGLNFCQLRVQFKHLYITIAAM